jgi:hypothetical protein
MHRIPFDAAWRKSQRSTQQGACVEVADLTTATAIRDSKDPDGPMLVFGRGEFAALLGAVKAGELDL